MAVTQDKAESSDAGWTLAGPWPSTSCPQPRPDLRAGRKGSMHQPSRCQRGSFTQHRRMPHPHLCPDPPGVSRPIWEEARGQGPAAVPTELLGAGQKNTILTCLGILFLHPAGGAGKGVDLSVSPLPGRELPEPLGHLSPLTPPAGTGWIPVLNYVHVLLS